MVRFVGGYHRYYNLQRKRYAKHFPTTEAQCMKTFQKKKLKLKAFFRETFPLISFEIIVFRCLSIWIQEFVYTGSQTTYRVASLPISLVKFHSKNNKQIKKLVHWKFETKMKIINIRIWNITHNKRYSQRMIIRSSKGQFSVIKNSGLLPNA